MIGRIFLFGSAVLSVLLLTIIYAIVSGQYLANQPTPEPSPSITEPGPSGPQPSGSQPSGSPDAEPSPSASGEGATVTMENSEFSSADLAIAAGTIVTFTNDDAFDHTVSEGVDGELATDALFDLELAAGASDTFTFTEPGTYQVTCTLHPTMNMTITVE